MKGTASVVAMMLLLAMSGCVTAEQWGFPRVPIMVQSPDGEFVAYVRNHPSLDPFEQSIWLRSRRGPPVQLARVPPDAWWCDQIVWSGDSRRVAFIVANAIVHVYDAASRKQVFSGFVGRRSWDTPPKYVLSEVSLSHDGASIAFRECTRKRVAVAAGSTRRAKFELINSDCRATPETVAFAQVPAEKMWP